VEVCTEHKVQVLGFRCKVCSRKVTDEIFPVLSKRAYGGSKVTASLILGLGTKGRWKINFTFRPFYIPGRNLGTHWIGGWSTPELVAESFADEKHLLYLPGFDPRTVQPVAQW